MSRREGVRKQLKSRLEELGAWGVDGLPRPERPTRPTAKKTSRSATAKGPEPPVRERAKPIVAEGPPEALPSVAPDEARVELAGDLDGLRTQLSGCSLCSLCERRTQIVFGVGAPDARLMFVGEAPGREEDLQGEPFVGKAGELLTGMIEKGMKLPRSSVYIANVVKCRPPQNRDPEPAEVAACEPFLKQQVELVKPEVIVALGRFAAQCLLKTSEPIGKLRGRWHDYGSIPLMPTFHPAYLLRTPSQKRAAWGDLKAVLRKLEG